MTTLRYTNTSARAGLARYACAAMLARIADGGGVLAVILLCQSSEQYFAVTGWMAACITLPHMLGPFIARRIDTASDGRKVIAAACLAYSVITGLMTATFGHVPLLLTALLLIAAGLCGPLLTGGISTFQPAIAGPDQRSQRRAQGLDVATYGFGGTIGPSAVAAISAWASPDAAFYLLALGTVIAAFFIMRLPVPPVTLVGMIVSFALLSAAMRSLPLGTAYTIWTGIGAVGSFAAGLYFLGEPATPMRILAAVVIVVGLIMMKLAS